MKSNIKKVLTAVVAVGLIISMTSNASAANKTISCYKGTTVKKVTAAKPKCPAGYTTKKPAAAKAGSVAFNSTYKGNISIAWSDTSVQATSVTATGTGSSAPQAQCNAFQGKGVLSGGGNTLNVEFGSGSEACADSDAAPATVEFKGNANITGGTGKYAGASGTLKVSGSFAIKSTVAGSKESPALSLTLSGNVTTK